MNAGAASFPDGVNVDLLMRNASKLKDLDFCEPEDIAAAVAFLASQEARFISGTVLSVDGAQTGVGVHRRGETRPASPPSLRTM
jgi:NAD(P)-dependent dehydrogenase (short-subunit alcohol dehydrogenase family)